MDGLSQVESVSYLERFEGDPSSGVTLSRLCFRVWGGPCFVLRGNPAPLHILGNLDENLREDAPKIDTINAWVGHAWKMEPKEPTRRSNGGANAVDGGCKGSRAPNTWTYHRAEAVVRIGYSMGRECGQKSHLRKWIWGMEACKVDPRNRQFPDFNKCHRAILDARLGFAVLGGYTILFGFAVRDELRP